MAKAQTWTAAGVFPEGKQASPRYLKQRWWKDRSKCPWEQPSEKQYNNNTSTLVTTGLFILRRETLAKESLLVMGWKSQQVWGFSTLHHLSNLHQIHGPGKVVVNRCSGKLDHLQSVYKYFPLAYCQFCHPPQFGKTCGYVLSHCPLGPFWWDWCWRREGLCRNLHPPHHHIHKERCHPHSLGWGSRGSHWHFWMQDTALIWRHFELKMW